MRGLILILAAVSVAVAASTLSALADIENAATIHDGMAFDKTRRSPAGITWHIEVVDSNAQGGGSLALDNSGHPHISYAVNTPSPGRVGLKYAYWTGSQWLSEIADSLESGGSTDLGLDSSERPHIGYSVCNPYSCGLKYAQWAGSLFLSQDIDPSISGASKSFALDTDGHPHFAYCKQAFPGLELELRHAYWSGSEWILETIEIGGCWYSTSIEIDSSGYAHISYYDQDNGDLKYTRWTGSAWDVQTVDSDGFVGLDNSLSLDTSSQPHISYYDWDNRNLKYATWAGSNWNVQTVDSNDDVGEHTSLALGSDGYPRISYIDATNDALKYAYWTGSEWQIDAVETLIGDNDATSLALDSQNQPHISYYYYGGTGNRGLRYAWGEVTPDAYFISGRVTENGSNPVPGVTISDGAGHTATTDSNGDYVLDGLQANAYTLIPTMSGYSFSPPSRTVILPPNATNQDFVADANRPPNSPSNPSPSNGATNQSLNVDLSWTGGDPDGDNVTYDVFFEGEDDTPENLICDDVTTPECDLGTLAHDTQYYWTVLTTDEHGEAATGDTWTFHTESELNDPPHQPHSPVPIDGATDVPVTQTLSWQGGDPDSALVTYTVAFGTSDPPPIAASSLTDTQYHPGELEADTTYHWAITVTDGISVIVGPMWEFKTAAEQEYAVYLPLIMCGNR